MKRFLSITYLFALSGFMGWLSTGCANDASDKATPDAPCRIQQSIAVSKSRFHDQNNQTTYGYNAQGSLVRAETTMDRRPAGGATARWTGTKIVTYTYDADGYLTASTTGELYVTTTIDKTIREQMTTTQSYSYTGGRLAGNTITYTNGQGMPSTAAYAYTYNNAGELTQVASVNLINPNGQTTIWIYQNDRLVDYVEKSGTTERRPYTIQNGVVTKMVFPGSIDTLVVTATADNQQRIIKREEFVNGQLRQYDVQTWTDAKPSTASLPPFKGFPTVTPARFSGQVGVLASRSLFYWNAVSKTMQPYNESTSAVQTNAQGFVTNAVTTVKHAYSADQDVTTTETHTYTGCQ